MPNLTNIILCGGSGTRLWPLSRTLMPKQFLTIFDGESLFQLTYKRNASICKKSFIVSNEEQYFLALDQLENMGIKENYFLLEPVGRNTAPAITLACFGLDLKSVVLVTPSDHLIKDEKTYKEVVKKAKKEAENGSLVTFGIKPTRAETGYGYIEADGFYVKNFHEKPDEKTALKYLKEGNYFWNSGIFCFKVETFLTELKTHAKDIYTACKKAYEAKKSKDPIRIDKKLMQSIPDQSIDYAVMEKSKNIKVIPCDIKWNDVGSFDTLSNELPNDKNGNLIISENKTIKLIDIEDTIIVDTNDALLVCKKGSSQKVKIVHETVKKDNIELVNIHKTAHRPWGTYTVLESKHGYKIKRIEVKPNKKLSLQKHYHRSEHWIVISGIATVTVGKVKKYIHPNESTYIKKEELHRLENKGKAPVILIEAQVGEYVGEDDIVRVDDEFGRK